MYCRNCGRELSKDSRYCPGCGAEQISQATYDDPFTTTVAPEIVEKKPAKVWSIFSKIGKIFGIVTISTCWIPVWGMAIALELGIVGIVFCCLGRKAKTDVADSNYRTGLKLAIPGIIISIVVYVVWLVILSATGYTIGSSILNGIY